METTNNKLIDRIISGLKNAATELEEFQLQLALGKSEASDKYEEAKKTFNDSVHDFKIKMKETWSQENGLKQLITELEELLLKGKAENTEAFKTQRNKILEKLNAIEETLKIGDIGAEIYAHLSNEIEKFKIKLDILSLRYELGKMEFKQEFEERKSDFSKKVASISGKFSEAESEIEKQLEHFGKELTEAYSHLKKAFMK